MSEHPTITAYRNAGQGHVFAFFGELSPSDQKRLLEEAAEIDLGELARLTETLLKKTGSQGVNLDGLEPAPYEPVPENGGDLSAWGAARRAGEKALTQGRVALFTVAGGQGTRLGFDGPKGTFPVTPVRGKTLFQVFAEKVIAAGRRYGRPLHWFIMTSHQNHEATQAFFAEHEWFGLDPKRVHLFRQGRMPAVDFEGKILLESKGSIAMSPDGHGGSLRALDRSGAIDLMEREGIDTVSYFQVDNPLVRCVDPVFIGWHLLCGSEMSSKTVPKAYPEEKLGHFCVQNGKRVVIEYSDLPMELQKETDSKGKLRYRAGSIAIHIFDRDFIGKMAGPISSKVSDKESALPFHRADKKIPTIDSQGRPLKPEKPNGVKFELFVFDALPFANHPMIIETRRVDDFSPVKNAVGVDSPKTSRDDQLKQFARWLKANGAPVPVDAAGLPTVSLEVSPLFGYDEDSFAESWKKLSPHPKITDGLYLG